MSVTLDESHAQLDLVFDRGDDFDVPFDFGDANDDPTTSWADATFKAQARRSPNDPTAVDFTIDTSEWTATRRIRLQLAKTITVGLARSYSWDLEITSGGALRTRLGGTLCAREDTTK